MTSYSRLIHRLGAVGVDCILIGGVAATIHGSSRLTQDVDIVYSRESANITRLVEALKPFTPYLRGAPAGLPFTLDETTITSGLNFTLTTTLGDLDIFGQVAGGGSYEDLLPHSVKVQLFGTNCLCLGLRKLIEVKRAAGRRRDLEAVAELEAILKEQSALE